MKQLDTKLMHPAEQIKVIIGRIYRSGMTTTSGGNVSIMDDNGDMWITPSAIDKGSLTERDIICVKADGTIVGPHPNPRRSIRSTRRSTRCARECARLSTRTRRTRIVQHHTPDSQYQHYPAGAPYLRQNRVCPLRMSRQPGTGPEDRSRVPQPPRLQSGDHGEPRRRVVRGRPHGTLTSVSRPSSCAPVPN